MGLLSILYDLTARQRPFYKGIIPLRDLGELSTGGGVGEDQQPESYQVSKDQFPVSKAFASLPSQNYIYIFQCNQHFR